MRNVNQFFFFTFIFYFGSKLFLAFSLSHLSATCVSIGFLCSVVCTWIRNKVQRCTFTLVWSSIRFFSLSRSFAHFTFLTSSSSTLTIARAVAAHSKVSTGTWRRWEMCDDEHQPLFPRLSQHQTTTAQNISIKVSLWHDLLCQFSCYAAAMSSSTDKLKN